jgi:cytochrome c oxidase subunit 2
MKTSAKTALALLASVLLPATAMAAAGQAEPWQIGLQDAASPVSEYIHWFHNMLLVIITVITLFVLALLIYVMVKFNAKANPVPSKTTHHAGLEVAWTVIPVLILVIIAIPSFRLLYLQRDIPQADMTLKVIGNPAGTGPMNIPTSALTNPAPPR